MAVFLTKPHLQGFLPMGCQEKFTLDHQHRQEQLLWDEEFYCRMWVSVVVEGILTK
jgi:hypothetical protein